MTEDHHLEMQRELDALRSKKRDLDGELSSSSRFDQFGLMRRKREGVAIKTRITMLEKMLYPDIIA